MITIKNYPPVHGPYRRRPSLLDYAVNITGLCAIGALLAVSVLGMTGAFERDDQPMTLACVTCAGGVR